VTMRIGQHAGQPAATGSEGDEMSVDPTPKPFRLDDAAIQEDPFAHYVDLREQAPVLETDLGGKPAWVLSRREDIAAALLDTTAFSSRTVADATLLHSDPPDHRALRTMVSGLFTRAAVSSVEPFIARRSAELLDEFVAAGACDIVDDFAGPLTVSVSSRLFGIAVDDVEQLRTWTRVSAEYQRALRLGTQAPEGSEDAFRHLFDFAGRLVASSTSEADTVVARLARLTADGELTRQQSAQYMVLLLVAGHSTTTNLIANSTYVLTQHPQYAERLRDDPSFGEKFIEEVLRYRPSFQRIPRVATRDVEVSGTTIPSGSTVYLLLGSANRDPRTFDDPEAFDPDQLRTMHVSFGHGIHTCMGQWLARMEGRLAVQLLAARVGSVTLDAADGPVHLSGGTGNEFGFHHLPVRLVPLTGRQNDTPQRGDAAVASVRRRATGVVTGAQDVETDVRVESIDTASDGVVTLELRRPDGGALPPWEPGAHIDLVLGEVPTRQYSLCGDPRDRSSFRIGVLRDPGGRGSSLYVHDRLKTGDVVRVRGPRNHFPLVAAPRYLFIAGGIGITPLLPMIAEADAAGADWNLVYGGRHRASMAFLPELEEHASRVTVWPQDEHGLLNLTEILGSPEADTHIYCCGPEPLVAAVEAMCEAWPPGALHVERFGPRPGTSSAAAKPFEVVLERSRMTLTVPADRSILETVEEAGVFVLASCREGTCGTCETAVIEGEVDHRDTVLDEAARAADESMMICVSRCTSPRLVLGL
jgi:cytochrome P450/ferredoxin-NADP reductase